MDRSLYTSQEQLRSFDLLWFERDVTRGVGLLSKDLLGSTATLLAGFAATPDSPADLSINIAAGEVYQLANVDTAAFGAIGTDTTQVMQQGIALASQKVTLNTSGLSSGQSQWWLIQAQFSQSDAIRTGDPTAGILNFFNSANPSQPFVGPNNTGVASNTVRLGQVVIQAVAGTPATTGSEVPPNPSAGFVPLYLVDLAFGQTQITAPQILTAGPSVGTNVPSNYPAAPFLTGLLQSHHGGVPGQGPKVKLASEVQGTLPYANLAALNHGQCRLALSGGNLLLSPYSGNNLNINGTPQAIPSAGVSLSPSGLLAPVNISTVSVSSNVATINTATAHGFATGNTAWVNSSNLGVINGTVTVTSSTQYTIPLTHANLASTADTGSTGLLYYVYAFMVGATMTLEAVPVGHSTSATTGVEQKSTDATRALVGLARTVAGPAFADSLTQRFVASWFNRALRLGQINNISTSTSSAALTPLANTLVEVLSWGDEEFSWNIGGSASNPSTSSSQTSPFLDGAAVTPQPQISISAGFNVNVQTSGDAIVAEGYHNLQVAGSSGVGTTTWSVTSNAHVRI